MAFFRKFFEAFVTVADDRHEDPSPGEYILRRRHQRRFETSRIRRPQAPKSRRTIQASTQADQPLVNSIFKEWPAS